MSSKLPPSAPIYRLAAVKPGLDFLRRREQVTVFGVQIRDLLERIATEHPELKVLHVFAGVPAPIAVELGRHLRIHVPCVQMYEWNKSDRAYWPSLRFHPAAVLE